MAFARGALWMLAGTTLLLVAADGMRTNMPQTPPDASAHGRRSQHIGDPGDRQINGVISAIHYCGSTPHPCAIESGQNRIAWHSEMITHTRICEPVSNCALDYYSDNIHLHTSSDEYGLYFRSQVRRVDRTRYVIDREVQFLRSVKPPDSPTPELLAGNSLAPGAHGTGEPLQTWQPNPTAIE